MTLDEIENVLKDAIVLRVPRRDPDATARAHIESLEDYMLDSAYVNGSLVEARHWLRALEAMLGEEWERLQGWETMTSKPRARLTKQDIQDAKIKTAPEKYAAGKKVSSLRGSVDDQIARFEREATIVSRAYTMATGG